MLKDSRKITDRRPAPPKPPFELKPEIHDEIHRAARSGESLNHFSPQALVAYGLSGASPAHFRALEEARSMKEAEFEEVINSVPVTLRGGLKKTFTEFLNNNYPKPKKHTNYHA